MRNHIFQEGDPVSFQGKTGEIDYYANNHAVITFVDGSSLAMPKAELTSAFKGGELILVKKRPHNPFRIVYDLPQKESIVRWERYLHELDKHPLPCAAGVREQVIEKVSALIDDPNPPSTTSLYRKHRAWRQNGRDTVAILFGNQRTRKPKISAEVLNLMDKIIRKFYLKPSRPSIKSAYSKFMQAYHRVGYMSECPSYSTFQRRIKEFNRLDIIVNRYGASAAREEGRTATSKTKNSRILEAVSMDAAHFNLGLKNSLGNFVGMPSIYFVMDDHSRVILGFGVHIGKQSETSACVIHTLYHAMSKKNDPRFPYFGIPGTIIVDQGTAYVSDDTMRFYNSLQVNLTKTATRMGWGKPMIERFIGTCRTRFFSEVDGYLGKRDPKMSSDTTLKKSAKHTVDEFVSAFVDFIAEYHRTPHIGLNGKSPHDVWMESAKENPPILLEDMGAKHLVRGLYERKVLKHVTGITCDYQNFNSDQLQKLYHDLQPNKKPGVRAKVVVDICRDPLDASAISVVDPVNNRMLDVPNVLGSDADGKSFSDLRYNRAALEMKDEVPQWVGEINESYAKNRRRKGPDVIMGDMANPPSLDKVFLTEEKPVPVKAPTVDYEYRGYEDEEDDFVVEIEEG